MTDGSPREPAASSRDPEILSQWAGREAPVQADRIGLRPARLMCSLMHGADELAEGSRLPPLWHWLYFPDATPLAGLGRDGHPERGGFLPPVALPRRMWAGGRFGFGRGLRIGDQVRKRSVILRVEPKQGRSGALCFVTIRHGFEVTGEEVMWEEHDIVYREDPAPGTATAKGVVPPEPAEARETVTPSPVMLFRYSALTFNGHRIHYDRDYCRDVEGYPGLVFHGPLTATLLAGLAERHFGRRLKSFTFRAVAPLFDTAPFEIAAGRGSDGVQFWAETPEGYLAMQARATFVDWTAKRWRGGAAPWTSPSRSGQSRRCE